MLQHEGGCVQCGEQRTLSPQSRMGAITQISCITEDNQKIVVGLCDSCYASGNFDMNKIKNNLIASEKDWAAHRGLDGYASKFENVKFVGAESYLK